MRGFGERLRKLRETTLDPSGKKLSGARLAEALNLSQGFISAVERGEKMPSVETLNAIARYFDVTMDFLLGDSDITISSDREEKGFLLDDDDEIIRIRVFPLKAVASFTASTNFDEVVVEEENVIDYIFVSKQYLSSSNMKDLYAVQIKDNAMQGAQMIKGQLAIIERTPQVNFGDVMLICYHGHPIFRWLIATNEENTIELRPANADYKSDFITLDNTDTDIFTVKGQVVGVLNMPHVPQRAF